MSSLSDSLPSPSLDSPSPLPAPSPSPPPAPAPPRPIPPSSSSSSSLPDAAPRPSPSLAPPPPPPPPSSSSSSSSPPCPRAEWVVLSLGRRRQRLLLALTLLPCLFLSFILSSDTLLTRAPPHRCALPPPAALAPALRPLPLPQLLNMSLPGEGGALSQCQQYPFQNGTPAAPPTLPVACQRGWVYNRTEGLRDNMVTEWDLVCERYWMVPVEEVCFMLGVLTGCLLLGYTADRCGRLKALLSSLSLSAVFGVLVCVAPSPSIFIITRFLLAAATAGAYLTLYITRVELCDPSLRLMVTMAAGLVMVAGEFLLLGVALGCQSWRGLQGAITAPLALFLSYGVPGVFPESPRWLLLSGRQQPDVHSFTERREREREREREEDNFTELDSVSLFEPASRGAPWLGMRELLHCRNIAKNICVLGFTSFISHGIHRCYTSFRGDVRGTPPSLYWSWLVSSGTGGLACAVLCVTVDRCGRRGILLLAMTMTGLASLILLGLIEYLSEAAITVFSVLGLFSSQAAASLCIFFTAEIVPTVIRGCGVGVVVALGWVGRLSAPFMDLHNHYGYFLHHVVYSSLALLCVLSILLLPESKRKPLPETLADGEAYRRPPLGRRRKDNVPLLSTPNPSI
ncbi:solute carrier family 22 member 17 [Amia ocellicauda]|uniref:solute carrier family 22 member 17 n=1 Tax=Amia ocellicauda TaxID=2972642 RepID=UPI00346434FD